MYMNHQSTSLPSLSRHRKLDAGRTARSSNVRCASTHILRKRDLGATGLLLATTRAAKLSVCGDSQKQGDDVSSPAYMHDMRGRIHRVLLAAYGAGSRSIVLGAWGCGVFMNNPPVIARLFCEVLATADWCGRFDAIVFAILEPRGASVRARAFQRGLDCGFWHHFPAAQEVAVDRFPAALRGTGGGNGGNNHSFVSARDGCAP